MSSSSLQASSTNWSTLSVELQQLILEQLSYRELKIIQRVSKKLQALSSSTPSLRSSLFFTEKVDLVALYTLVGMPELAAATVAKVEKLEKAKQDLEEDGHYYDDLAEEYYDDDGLDEEGELSLSDVGADVIKLHPLLHALRVFKTSDGKLALRTGSGTSMEDLRVSKVVQENATEPPLGNAQVGVSYRFTGSGGSRRVGCPFHTSQTPIAVQQTIETLGQCLEDQERFMRAFGERFPTNFALPMLPIPSLELRISNKGIFELVLEF